MTTAQLDAYYADLDHWIGRAKRAEEDARRLYVHVLCGGDRDEVTRRHLETTSQATRRIA